jgi:AcrR family transcriptional regulator
MRDVCCSPGITLADQGWADAANGAVYDLLADAEECFLAAFDLAIERVAAVVVPAWESEQEWTARVRAALAALLRVLDAEPGLCRLVFVEAPAAGPRVVARRAEVLELVAAAIDGGRSGVKGGELPSLAAEAIVGAVFGVIHARLVRNEPEALTGLLDPLIAAVVLPYAPHVDGVGDGKCEPGRIRHKEICDVD